MLRASFGAGRGQLALLAAFEGGDDVLSKPVRGLQKAGRLDQGDLGILQRRQIRAVDYRGEIGRHRFQPSGSGKTRGPGLKRGVRPGRGGKRWQSARTTLNAAG